MIEKKLEVKDLTISFRTVNGKVQAVRDISFDLYRGETLAIVGESGSGKSVTSRAILGISAGNAMIEGGEILYDGRDLLKISEEDFHKIRGDKIAMVFQDPLSSLNPIMKVGKQLTEAMLLKNKARRRECHRDFRRISRCLNESMDEASSGTSNVKGENGKLFSAFRKVVFRQLSMEKSYMEAMENAETALSASQDLLIEMDRAAVPNLIGEAQELREAASHAYDRFVVHGQDKQALASALKSLLPACRKTRASKDYADVIRIVTDIKNVLTRATQGAEKPDFFALGYSLEFRENKIPDMPVSAMNKETGAYLSEHFMDLFASRAQAGVARSAARATEKRVEAAAAIAREMPAFEHLDKDHAEVRKAASRLESIVASAIDPLETVKDSTLYTFSVSLDGALDIYFDGIRRNATEQSRFDRQTKKYQQKASRGKTPDWKVVPLSLVDLELARENVLKILRDTRAHLEARAAAEGADYAARTQDVIAFLRDCASGEAHRISRSSAKTQAIKLMESVGISEPRKRYNQYPFEFSGGMRQRIVIAISLTANPDVLICDEPTTALDVTIQAQILELINKLKRERNLSVIFITHDLGVVANMADRIAVMYAGKIVEYGTAEDVFYSPAHPYTWALLSSIPDLDTSDRLESIPGTPPNMIYPPKGDAFAQRNKYAMQIDFEEQPPLFQISDTHYAATWLRHPSAPKVDPPKIVTDRIARMKKSGGSDNER